MRLSALEVRLLRMPLVRPFRSATVTEIVRSVVLVRAVTTEAEGWAECVAMSEPFYTSEYVEEALDVMRRHLAPLVLGLDDVTAESASGAMASVKGHPMARCAIEAAVLDAELRTASVRLADHLGA